MPIKTYTLEEVWDLSEKCVLTDDRKALGELAELVAEDGNLYTEVDLDRIIKKIESDITKFN